MVQQVLKTVLHVPLVVLAVATQLVLKDVVPVLQASYLRQMKARAKHVKKGNLAQQLVRQVAMLLVQDFSQTRQA